MLIDWDSLRVEHNDEEIEEIVEDRLYELLGLRDEDENTQNVREAARTKSNTLMMDDTLGAAIPVDDFIPEERTIVYDKDNPKMDPDSLYPSMKEFRLAIRQFAINNEFELGVESSDKFRYRAYCKSGDCPWRIHTHREKPDANTIVVVVVNIVHNYTSSNRRKTTTPSSSWVASKALRILRQNHNIGAKELQKKVQDDHKCTVTYDTAWKGREKSLKELYGNWKDSFKQLYSWKAEVLKKLPNSVIEIETKEVDGQIYFHRFFCALESCIEGFLDRCRPYLSIDSSALNGRWNNHLAAACSVDGHNWMYPVAFGFMDSEIKDNWTWFMSQLHKAIGSRIEYPDYGSLLAICTDAYKGLENVVKNVFPYAEKRKCFRHLMENFINRFGGGEHMFPAARSYKRDKFKQHMVNFLSNLDVVHWIQTYHSLK